MLDVVSEVVPGSELNQVRNQLPDDWDELWEVTDQGSLVDEARSLVDDEE